MKIIIFIISLFYAANNFAQNTAIKTITINVKGNCEECKDRIENAVDIKGVKHAIWNEVNQILTITYLSNKITSNEIEKVIAASGHDTPNYKSLDYTYNKLPSCCKYRDKKCENK